MALDDFAFNAKHIPGSIQVDSEEKAKKFLLPDDVVVPSCFKALGLSKALII